MNCVVFALCFTVLKINWNSLLDYLRDHFKSSIPIQDRRTCGYQPCCPERSLPGKAIRVPPISFHLVGSASAPRWHRLCYRPRRNHWSSTFGRRSFSTAAPLTWNSLPPAVLNSAKLPVFATITFEGCVRFGIMSVNQSWHNLWRHSSSHALTTATQSLRVYLHSDWCHCNKCKTRPIDWCWIWIGERTTVLHYNSCTGFRSSIASSSR